MYVVRERVCTKQIIAFESRIIRIIGGSKVATENYPDVEREPRQGKSELGRRHGSSAIIIRVQQQHHPLAVHGSYFTVNSLCY